MLGKRIVFATSAAVWGGGTLFSGLLTFDRLEPWQILTIVIIAVLITAIYTYFFYNITNPNGWKKDLSQMAVPNLVALFLVFLTFNHFIGFHIEESLRKYYYADELEYSGIEASINKDIQDIYAKKFFEERKKLIGTGKGIDQDFLVGCWFTLSPPQKSSQNCYTKKIEIKIKQNKYGRIWDLFYPVYLLNDDFKAEADNFYYDVDGVKKYGYKLNITCINPGKTLKVIFVLGRKEDSVLSPDTWKNVISIKFSDN
jgi:hypothetical protein